MLMITIPNKERYKTHLEAPRWVVIYMALPPMMTLYVVPGLVMLKRSYS